MVKFCITRDEIKGQSRIQGISDSGTLGKTQEEVVDRPCYKTWVTLELL